MRPEPGAVLFDLDDTLYPRRRFLLSGFAAVAQHLDRHWGVDARQAFLVLVDGLRTSPGTELQSLVGRYALPPWLVPQMVDLIRGHVPRLRLPRCTARTLARLRDDWRLGIVTNGPPAIQARKVRALGLEALVDIVIYAQAVGRGVGKPDAEPFLEAARRLGVEPWQVVFVGDDPVADIAGAHRAGMRTIHVRPRRPGGRHAEAAADAAVDSMDAVPRLARQLVDERRTHVV
jgi:putative hydrolase of the HAD superfamily